MDAVRERCLECWAPSAPCAERLLFALVVCQCVEWGVVALLVLASAFTRSLELSWLVANLVLVSCVTHGLLAVALNMWARLRAHEQRDPAAAQYGTL